MADHEAQELSRRDTKDTLAQVEFPAVSPEAVEGFLEVGYEAFLIFCLDHIVDVSLDVFVELCCEATLDCLLVGGASIFQPKGHGVVAIDAEGRYKRRLILVGWIKGDLVIARVVVKKAEQDAPHSGVYNLVHTRKREGVLRAVFVKIDVVDTHSTFTSFLLCKD